MDLVFLGRGQLSGKFERDRLRGVQRRSSLLPRGSVPSARIRREDNTGVHTLEEKPLYIPTGLGYGVMLFAPLSRLFFFFFLIRVGLLSRPME